MQAISQAIPPSDYIEGPRPVDVIVKPWPCQDCEHSNFCRDTGSQCRAWRQYDSVGRNSGNWDPADRMPDRLAQERKIASIAERHFPRQGRVLHNGYEFNPGSVTESIYLIIKELRVASNADIAKALKERSVVCSRSSLKSTTQRMFSKGQLNKLPGVGYSWGPKAK